MRYNPKLRISPSIFNYFMIKMKKIYNINYYRIHFLRMYTYEKRGIDATKELINESKLNMQPRSHLQRQQLAFPVVFNTTDVFSPFIVSCYCYVIASAEDLYCELTCMKSKPCEVTVRRELLRRDDIRREWKLRPTIENLFDVHGIQYSLSDHLDTARS